MIKIGFFAGVFLGCQSAPDPWEEKCGSQTILEGMCCCLRCGETPEERMGAGEENFVGLPVAECTKQGGQCKHHKISAYNRGRKSNQTRALVTGDGPGQVHMIGGYPDEVTIVFVTSKRQPASVELRAASNLDDVMVFKGSTSVYTSKQVRASGNEVYSDWNAFTDDLMPQPDTKRLAACTDKGWDGYRDPNCIYTSGLIHTVKLTGLIPGTKYEFRPFASDRWRPFKTSPAIGQPISFGVVADLGQTTDSLATMRHMAKKLDSLGDDAIHAGIFIGDLAYADGYGNGWDNYGHLGEFLWERLPTAYTSGNHEWANEQYAHFVARYPSPNQQEHDSFTPHWYGFKAGLAHVIQLCSYCESTPGSLQYEWLQEELERVDRSVTPWLIVTTHVQWYTSNEHHSMEESVTMRNSLEPMLYKAKTDVFMVGHLHAYERTKGIFQNQTTCDGIVHITIGDGGNHEGPACPWYQQVPDWEDIREYSFGHGVLAIKNETHAHWTWHRNQDGENVMADDAWLLRASDRCDSALV